MGHDDGTVTYRSAGGVVIDEAGDHVLVLIRPARDEVRLPKGHIESEESLAETALRETREEAGYQDLDILADLGQQLVTFLYEGNRVRRTEHYYLMQVQSAARMERPEHDAAQFYPVWVPWDEVQAHLTYEAEREWARRAQRAWEQMT